MNLIPKKTVLSTTWSNEDVRAVSGFYGPGAIFAWLITSVSMLYDANQNPQAGLGGFDWAKYGATILVGFFALSDAVWRALHLDFGPSHAAALYMSDKGLELGLLLYTVRFFPIHRSVAPRTRYAQRDAQPPVLPTISSQVVHSFSEYKLYPCVAMVGIWAWCRALSNGHDVYSTPAQNSESPMFQWEPILPWWCKPIAPILLFGITAVINRLKDWDWWAWGLPAGVHLSFAALHSGLFGAFAPLKLTTINIMEFDQIAPLVTVVGVLLVQYGRESALVSSMGRYLRRLFVLDEATTH
ncbi:hypothetical protein E8E14_001503 [Neopestalotiopsis sp. 37M]|nr:hypothetical protein E8E14_001503 [Neopestalotiopsis sp. 37M]